jgi:hypothetical protein
MSEALIFDEIAKQVTFKQLLDYYDIGYEEDNKGVLKFRTTNKEGKEVFALAIPQGNYFFTKEGEKAGGNPIKFVQWFEGLDARPAASKIKNLFISPEEKKLPEYELFDHESIEEILSLRRHFDFGYCKSGIMAGNIAFKCFDPDGNYYGYVGWHPKKHTWFFPKGFKRQIYNIEKANSKDCILTTSPFEVMRVFLQGYTNVLGTMGKSLTEIQVEQLKRFDRILLLHPDPSPLVQRLAPNSFIRCLQFKDSVDELGELAQYF